MGGSQSTEKPDYMSYMARLSLKDYKNDEKFWTELITLAPSRIDVPYPYPRLMNEIAVKFPQNFLRLILICVQHLNLLKDGVSVSVFPDMILDQFSLSLLIFNTCLEALIYNEKLIPILNRLDIQLAQCYIKSRPQLESYISLSQKKRQEQNKTVQEEVHPAIQQIENNSNQSKPSVEKLDSPKPPANSLFASMQLYEGHVVNSMISSLSSCMFKLGLTLENEDKDWNQSTQNYKNLNLSRRDIIHSIYFLNSLDYFLPEDMNPKPHFQIDMSAFPFEEFLKSVSIVATKYQMNSCQNVAENEVSSLLQNCFGFLIQIFNTEPLTTIFSQIDSSVILQTLVLKDNPQLPLLIQPHDPLVNENLTFLYMSLFYQPNLSLVIANEGLANKFIFTLIEALQVTLEEVGQCYLHSLILSSILLLVADETISSLLNNPFNQNLNCKFQPHAGSYADVLLEILFNVSDAGTIDFTPGLAAVFQMIVPQVQSFSLISAEKLIHLFDEAVKAEKQKTVELLLEAFAEILQNKFSKENMIPEMIIRNDSLFKNLKTNEKININNNSLDIISTFLSEVSGKLEGANSANVNISNTLQSLDFSKIFTNVVSFMKHPQILNDDVANSWKEWSHISFKKSFEKELEKLTSLKTELSMQEQQIQYMKKIQEQQEQLRLQQEEQQKLKQADQEKQQTETKEEQSNTPGSEENEKTEN